MSDADYSQSKIDFTFISKLEGSSNKGYVPDPKTSKSGVTIGSGFDIGQRTQAELKQAFTGDLCKKLLPYADKIKQNACDVLAEYPLTVTTEEVDCINEFSHKNAQFNLIKEWQAADTYADFNTLSTQCQTVIASVSFQYGSLRLKTPNFWRQVTSGDWQAACKNLRNFGDNYPTRRNKEADLLETWLS
ncbi:pesticin C-terminus-like muramidase [Marinomonas sp. PE14-40]|uniref:pesticin C-terminus-like muramidase n=1 Tax=Marinomonas sp. PE14-40 TaxID=3060621 RepID=UPI003F675700